MAETVGRLCEVDGCGRPHRARGLCSTCYNQRHQPDRHRKVTVQCARCGKDCEKDATRHRRYTNLFCSDACKSEHWLEVGGGRAHLDRLHEARRGRPQPQLARTVARRKLRMAAKGTSGWGVLVAGICARPNCGEYFVRRYAGAVRPSPFCSSKCRRTERQRQRGIDDELRLAIYERDGWRCQIEGCGKPIKRGAKVPDPLAPTVDHLLPQVAGGGDEPANLRAAHFICNSGRRDRGTVQLALIG